MDKLTKQQEKVIEKLLHHSHNEDFTQFILKTIEEHNWTRGMLSNCVRHLTQPQLLLYESLGGGYNLEEDNVEIDFEISERLKEMGVTHYLYENEEYIDDIREGKIICEGIDVEEIKQLLDNKS